MNTVIYNAPKFFEVGQTITEKSHYGEIKHEVVFVDGARIATKTKRHSGEKFIALWEHKTYTTNEHVPDWSVVCKKESERPFILKNRSHSELEKCYWMVVEESMDDKKAVEQAAEEIFETAKIWNKIIIA